jgi:hypothetical protein
MPRSLNEPEIVRLRRENAALHTWRRAAIGVLADMFRDRDRAQVLVNAGLELREHDVDERPTLPDLAAIGLADDDEPSRGDLVIVEPRAPFEDIGSDGDGC